MKSKTIKPIQTETIYTFAHAPEIYSDSNGQFYRTSDDRPIPTTYQGGRIAVRDRNKFYGIKRLRSTALRKQREIIKLPF